MRCRRRVLPLAVTVETVDTQPSSTAAGMPPWEAPAASTDSAPVAGVGRGPAEGCQCTNLNWSPAWLQVERIMQGQWNATLSSLIVAYEVKWRCSPGCRASSNRSRCRTGIGTAPTAGAAQSIPSENSQRGVHLHCVVQSLHYCLPGTVYHLPAGNSNTRARTLQPRARLHCPGADWLSLALCRVRTT